jgi:alanine racemase
MDKSTAETGPPARPRLQINCAAAASNWRMMALRAPAADCAAVIKADAYGLGADALGPVLAAAGCRTFFTAYASEGALLRRALGPEPAIYVLHGRSDGEAALFVAAALTPVLATAADVAWWAPTGRPGALHIDTGMNRLGLTAAEAAAWPGPCALLMSHLVSAEDANDTMNRRQLTLFRALAQAHPTAPKSLANSAGVLLGRDYHFDLVRPGIALYGGEPVPDAPIGIAPVATVSAPIVQVRDLNPGDTVGYNATYTAPRAVRLATIALGYADGFLRAGAGRGYGVLAGARCPIVGRISMDLITLDVTAAAQAAQPGAEVEMLGAQAPVDAVATAAGTNSYEVLTRLGGRLKAGWGAAG